MRIKRFLVFIHFTALVLAGTFYSQAQTSDSIIITYDTIYSSPDTIIQNIVEEVIVYDTVASYWKADLTPAYSVFSEELEGLGEIPGIQAQLNFNYIIGTYFFRAGIGGAHYQKNSNTTTTDVSQVISLKEIDTTIILQQLIDDVLTEVEIPTTISVIDTNFVTSEYNTTSKNRFQFVTFSVSGGYIIDKGKFSMLNGIGLQGQYLLNNWDSAILDSYLNKNRLDNNKLRKLHISVFIENQTLYYLTDRFAAGINFSLGYKFNQSILKSNKTNKIYWQSGIALSFIL